MKKYLLLIENEELWKKFKNSIEKDINTEIIDLIKKRVKSGGNKKKWLIKEDKWLFLLLLQW